MKAVVAAFNQEKALVGAFSVIVKPIVKAIIQLLCIPVYIDMGLDNNNPVVLTVVTSGASFDRSFSVKVSQIECNSLSKGNPGTSPAVSGSGDGGDTD